MPTFDVRLTDGSETQVEADRYDLEGDWARFWTESNGSWEIVATAKALMIQHADADSQTEETV